MNSKLQLRKLGVHLCFVSNPISNSTAPSHGNGEEQLLCQNSENQTHHILRINGAIVKHMDP